VVCRQTPWSISEGDEVLPQLYSARTHRLTCRVGWNEMELFQRRSTG
jgi:hypothetical protein